MYFFSFLDLLFVLIFEFKSEGQDRDYAGFVGGGGGEKGTMRLLCLFEKPAFRDTPF
jgi:hypothetical protein